MNFTSNPFAFANKIEFAEFSQQSASGKSLAERLTLIGSESLRSLISNIAKTKLDETFFFLDQMTKIFHKLCMEDPNFDLKAKAFDTEQLVLELKSVFQKEAKDSISALNLTLQRFKLAQNDTHMTNLDTGLALAKPRALFDKIQEMKELADYRHHEMLQKIVQKQFNSAPMVQNMKQIQRVVKFDKMHRDAVNCIDICPMAKLLVSGSSDGTVKVVDLENMNEIKEINIHDHERKAIKAVCIDDKLNIVFVNEDNLLRIYSIYRGVTVAEYQGEALPDFADYIPTQAVQFTSDFTYLAFRNSSTTITIFDMRTKQIVRVVTCNDKIYDYSISPQRDLIAVAIYSECKILLIDIASGSIVSEHKLDCKLLNNT